MSAIQTYRQSVPSIFATSPSPKVSSKYTFVPTFDILENFEREGWNVASAKQVGNGSYATHEVRLRNSELPQVGDSLIEALIRNSHNGLTSFSVTAGLFRLVCSNGLTVPTSVSENITVKHLRVDIGTVREITDQFAERLPIIQRSVGKMETTYLNEEKTVEIVKKASMIRWQSGSIPSINVEELISPLRDEDKGNSVWKLFNVIQEKFVRGGTQYQTQKGRFVTMKNLKNFQSINKINTSLWELAESYC
jgi:hypothetical protein